MAPTELQPIMQRDGRTHDRKTQETIRLMAVERILEGEDITSVMASYGLCRTTARKWLAKARGQGRGKRMLAARKNKVVKDYVASTDGRLTLHFLPGYEPDLNRDELVRSRAKRTGVARRPLQKGEKLVERVREQLQAIANDPNLVRVRSSNSRGVLVSRPLA